MSYFKINKIHKKSLFLKLKIIKFTDLVKVKKAQV